MDKKSLDEWGGAKSHGNGVRPVELMIMNDTCATCRSRVPRRSSGRIKGEALTVEDERGPGLDFSLCFVCGSRPWGAAALLLCLFILLLKCLNVRRFPPPPSRSMNFATESFVKKLHITNGYTFIHSCKTKECCCGYNFWNECCSVHTWNNNLRDSLPNLNADVTPETCSVYVA